MIIQEYDFSNDTILQREINEDIFKTSIDEDIITEVVIATKNNSRQGSACAKTKLK